VGGVKDGGYGMHGMRDRVEALGGHLTVLSEPGAGTRIRAAIPAISISG
jgi:signal transduction histidine kinase